PHDDAGARDEPGKLRRGPLEVVQHQEDGDVPKVVGEHAGGHVRIFRPRLLEQVLETAPAESGKERGEIAEEYGAGRAIVDFEPVDVGPRPLPHEPARDERALPDPRNAGDDEDGGGRSGPGIEGPGLPARPNRRPSRRRVSPHRTGATAPEPTPWRR